MAVSLSPLGGAAGQFFDSNGNPLAGGKLYTYAAGTTTPQTTYTEYTGVTANSNPIVLNSGGRVPSEIWLTDGVSYKFSLFSALDNLIGVWDNVDGINSSGSAASDITFTGFKGQSGFVQDIADADGSDWIGYQPASPGAARSVQDKLRDTVSVKDFGAIGNGSTDDTAAIQAAITSLSATGGNVYFPKGTYKVSSTISWTGDNIFLEGAGLGATTISTFIATTDVFAINNVSGGGISNLNIIANTTQTDGAGVHLTNCYNVKITDAVIGYGLNAGVEIDGGVSQFTNTIQNFIISDCLYGIAIGGTGASPQDVFIADGIIGNCTNAGILVRQISGLYVNSIDILSCGSGLVTFPAAAKSTTNMFFTDVLCDTCTGSGWAFLSDGGSIEQVNMVNCWGASNTINGMIIASEANAFVVTNFRAINNRQRGIYIQGGTNLGFVNCQVLANSMVGAASFDGLAIEGSTTNNVSIIGGKYGSGWNVAGYNNQKFGIFISTGSINNYSIIGVDCTGNVTGSISDGGTGSVKHIYGNPGYTTIKSGSNFMAGGNNSVTVAHGLSVTPLAAELSITANSAMADNPFFIDTTTITSTSFDVKTTTAVAANSFFSWQARVDGA